MLTQAVPRPLGAKARIFRRFFALAPLVVFACSVTVHATAQEFSPPAKQVWIGSSGVAFGDGSGPDSPRDGSTAAKLDRILSELYTRQGDFGSGVYLRFLAGSYETGGISIRPNWWVEGAGIDQTVIKRVPTDRDLRFGGSSCQVITGGWGPQENPVGTALADRD
ncbi:hypothetical protein BH23VER1_BH23VER1_26290 [soil metagenome]